LQNLLAIVFLSEKDNITPLKRNIFGIGLNAFLNYFFGIRLHMNAAGFAIGTAISWTALCLWLYLSWARRHQISTWSIVKAQEKYVLPTAGPETNSEELEAQSSSTLETATEAVQQRPIRLQLLLLKNLSLYHVTPQHPHQNLFVKL